jgi:THO complex subunit 4
MGQVVEMEDIQMTSQGDFLASKITSSARPANIDMALDDVIMASSKDRRRPRQGSDRRNERRDEDRNNRNDRHSAAVRKPRDQRDQREHRSSRDSLRKGSDRRVVVDNRRDDRMRISIANGPKQPLSRLQVSNLHHEVTAEDLRELFATVAAVDRVNLKFDLAGRSIGVATVTFFGRNDAGIAADRFRNIPLDGMPMRVELLPPPEPLDRSARQGPERAGRWDHDAFHENNAQQRGRRDNRRRAPVSSSNLDDELDAYMMKKE